MNKTSNTIKFKIIITLQCERSQSDDVLPNVNKYRNVADEFYNLSNNGQQPLYDGCGNYSKLLFILKLYYIKCLCGMTEK